MTTFLIVIGCIFVWGRIGAYFAEDAVAHYKIAARRRHRHAGDIDMSDFDAVPLFIVIVVFWPITWAASRAYTRMIERVTDAQIAREQERIQ